MIASTMVRLLVAASVALPLAAQEPEATLVRCAEGSNRPCLVAGVRLTPDQLRRASGLRVDSLAGAWRARFLGDSGLFARGRRSRGEEGQSSRLLMLIDVSGSMRNLGIGTVKLVVRDFLRTLDSLPAGSLRVAIAPFGSRSVAQRIKALASRLLLDALELPGRHLARQVGLLALQVFDREILGHGNSLREFCLFAGQESRLHQFFDQSFGRIAFKNATTEYKCL